MDLIVQHAPKFDRRQAVEMASRLFGIEGEARLLPSERDQNFHLAAAGGEAFVLKIANALEDPTILDLQNAAIEHLTRTTGAATDAARGPLAVPRLVRTIDGEVVARVTGPDGASHMVRLLTYVRGRVLAAVRPHTTALLRSLGRRLAEMDRALETFSHPAMRRHLRWDLKQARWMAGELWRFADPDERGLIERVLERFERIVRPRLPELRTTVIHGDWNDYNVLVSLPAAADREVIGAIDFGDMLQSCTVFDVAIAASYAMLGKPDPVAAAADVVGGYHAEWPLTPLEVELLFDLVRTRLALSVTMARGQRELMPDNDYLSVSESQAWDLVQRLDAMPPAWAHYVLRHACGLTPCPRTARLVEWLAEHPARIAHVTDHDLSRAAVAVIDLSPGSLDVPNVEALADVGAFTRLVRDRLRDHAADVGVGRYDEARLVYSGDRFTVAGNDGAEPRTIHVGLDLFLPPGACVYAPLEGRVHSFRNNAAPRDYGPTIVLEHHVSDLPPFFTLYGHLSVESLDGLYEGKHVGRGERVGTVGDVDVNGGWPPHVHLQLIADLLEWKGDFPGVVAPSQREVWTSICPDPNLLARVPADRLPPRAMAHEAILQKRRRFLAPSLSVSYRRPLAIVRGHGPYLVDDDGRRYLDCVNNVAHVGHSHTRVVDAAARQLAILTTNTRYLHETLVAYAERLARTLPEPLSVCVFVNSGSEANELALRMARAHTGHPGIIVVEGAYHGNTTTLVDISPYKFDGPGGGGAPPHVRKVVMPDPYRGPYRGADTGREYARHVGEAIEELVRLKPDTTTEVRLKPDTTTGGVAAFICESLLSCGGQIVLPDGYLADVYRLVRAAGGVCIADEVQTGFGRVGSHMWGFETQQVTPDIVTLGKPIGNGFPLGAVVTRPEIAASFDNGMEYFNTFGGSPVACAVGLAVLDVLQDERLQANALDVGEYLKHRLRSLAERYPIVGDVRGLGLFLGIELVQDRGARQPAAAQASYVVNRARDRGVLLSTDGPDHNVIKIKPPLVFSRGDADRLVETLQIILQEDPAQP